MLGKLYKKMKSMFTKAGLKAEKQANRKVAREDKKTQRLAELAYERYEKACELAEQEDADWRYVTSTNRTAVTSNGKKKDIDEGPVMTQEFFVYGSLQPGRCNWTRLSEEVLNAERVQVPGHILILWSGFGGFIPDASIPTGKAMNWNLPSSHPKNYQPKGKNDVPMMAKGWILTMRGTKRFFDMLDAFEGFSIGKETGSYVRRSIWINGKWVWTYVHPKDDPTLEKVDEWLDEHVYSGYSRYDYGSTRSYYGSRSYGGSRYGTASSYPGSRTSSGGYSSYKATWEEDMDAEEEAYYMNKYGSSFSNLTKDQEEFAEVQNTLERVTNRSLPLALGPAKDDDVPDWVHEQRKLFDTSRIEESEFPGLSAGFDNAELATWSEDEDNLLKGESWKDFVEEHSLHKV